VAEKGDENAELVDSKEQTGAEGTSFFDRLRVLTSEDWEQHVVYVYRMEPRRPGTTKNPYLTKYSEVFDEESLKLAFGSGKYKCQLNKYPKSGKGAKTVEIHYAEILDTKFPPVLVGYDGWEADPRNAPWLWGKARGESAPNGQPTTIPNIESQAVKELADLTRKMLERGSSMTDTERKILMDANAAALRVVEDRAKTEGKGNDLSSLMGVMLQMKEFLAPGTAAATTDPVKMVTELIGLVKTLVPAAPAASQQNGLGVIKDFAETAKLMREAFGNDGESGGRRTPVVEAREPSAWEKVGGMIVEAIAPAMAPLGAAFGRLILKNAGDKEAATTELVPANNPHASGTPPPPVPADPQLQMVIDVAKLMRGAIELGLDGSEFAERFETKYGQTAYDTIVAVPQAEAIQQLQAFPQAWAILKPYEAQMPEFLAAFYEYGQPESGTETAEALFPGGKTDPQPKSKREKKVPV